MLIDFVRLAQNTLTLIQFKSLVSLTFAISCNKSYLSMELVKCVHLITIQAGTKSIQLLNVSKTLVITHKSEEKL
jgi:hypothetical protein